MACKNDSSCYTLKGCGRWRNTNRKGKHVALLPDRNKHIKEVWVVVENSAPVIIHREGERSYDLLDRLGFK